MLQRLSLRIRILLFFAALALGALAALGAGMALGYRRLAQPEALSAFVQAGVISGFAVLGLVVWVWFLFDLNVARAIEALSGAIRARAHADVDNGIEAHHARYLGDLAPAAAAALDRLAETRNALVEAVARETARLEQEKSRLEALLADVPVGVVLCSGQHRLVFYNGQAQELLEAGGTAPGLDRTLFEFLRAAPIEQAYQRLLQSTDPDATADLLCSAGGVITEAGDLGARLLAGRMRLVARPDPDATEAPGYVLTLRDVTGDLQAHARREQLLAEVLDRVRRPAAALQTVLGLVGPDGLSSAPERLALRGAMQAESARLTQAITELGARHDALRGDWSPLALTRAADLADTVAGLLEAEGLTLDPQPDPLVLQCNGFEIAALLASLARRIAAETGTRAFRLAIVPDGAGAMVRLGWAGPVLPIGLLEGWVTQLLDPAVPEVTVQAVLAAHGTDLWPETDAAGAALCLPIVRARRAGRRPAPISRLVAYDFDLLSRARNERIAETPLSQLNYVVFDTETTGLLPAQGDEIVQIAALRLVNGRRVAPEVLDRLVHPGRPIPPASTEVHGISDAMVADAPGPAEAIAAFHRFAEGAVLVAHNAPFDMAFLRRREAELGLRFDNPVLDTVLLSAVVFGQHQTHTLDALCHRLGVVIPEEARHTALGDAQATAEVFLKLVAMLQARGLGTFGQVIAEVRRHGRLLKDANSPGLQA